MPCNPKSYLEQLGHWTVSLNFSENTSTFLPVGTRTKDPLETRASLIGEPGEGLEELASFWLVVETNFLPLDKLRLLKLKVNHLLPRPLSGQGAGQGVLTQESFAWCNTFEYIFWLAFCFWASINLLFQLITKHDLRRVAYHCRIPVIQHRFRYFGVWQEGIRCLL